LRSSLTPLELWPEGGGTRAGQLRGANPRVDP
jgi:hypothetical protein